MQRRQPQEDDNNTTKNKSTKNAKNKKHNKLQEYDKKTLTTRNYGQAAKKRKTNNENKTNTYMIPDVRINVKQDTQQKHINSYTSDAWGEEERRTQYNK